VVGGNEYLSEMARKHGAPRTLTIPTPIDMNRYTEKGRGPSPSVRIGWIGGASTLFYLEQLHPVLREVCRSAQGAEVMVVSDAFPDWRDVPVARKPWSYEEEIQDLHSFDVGIMPLTDDAWARGKCGFKLLQYMAVGLPVICSPVGVNAEMVRNGINGFLARTSDDWVRYLRLLVQDPGMRLRLGEAARRTVTERYSLDLCAQRLASSLREAAGLGP